MSTVPVAAVAAVLAALAASTRRNPRRPRPDFSLPAALAAATASAAARTSAGDTGGLIPKRKWFTHPEFFGSIQATFPIPSMNHMSPVNMPEHGHPESLDPRPHEASGPERPAVVPMEEGAGAGDN